MKNILKPILVLMLLLSKTEAKTKTYPQVDKIVSVLDLNSELIQGIVAGMYPNMAIEFKEGSSIPLVFLSNYNIFSVKCDPKLSVNVDTTCYLRTIGKKLYMSVDLVNWKKARTYFKGRMVPNLQVSPDKSHVLVESNLMVDSGRESDEESVF